MDQASISILNLLEEIEFFKGFSPEEVGVLLDAGEWSKAEGGQIIINEGEIDLYMYVLIQGSVNVVLNEKVLAQLEVGETFGEFGLMGAKRTAHVVAVDRCLMLRFNAERLNLLPMELQIKYLKKILFTVFARLQKVNRRLWWELPGPWQ